MGQEKAFYDPKGLRFGNFGTLQIFQEILFFGCFQSGKTFFFQISCVLPGNFSAL